MNKKVAALQEHWKLDSDAGVSILPPPVKIKTWYKAPKKPFGKIK